jgi:hypothetical protein
VTPLALVLARAERRLRDRIEDLERRLEAGEDRWREYGEALQALVAVAAQLAPEQSGRLMSTAELAAKLGVSAKTVLRRRKRGELTPAVQLGERGRAALRWSTPR